jgi:hypothetical protein
VSLTTNHDRYYDALGLKRGASLPEVEEAWRQRSAEFHPDKFPSGSKPWATRRIQEINNARDELRRYWRGRREAESVEPKYEPQVRRVSPEPDPNSVQPDTIGFEPAAAGSPESPAGRGQAPLPAQGLRRGAVLAYSLAALLVLVALLAVSAALVPDPAVSGATAQQPADPPLPVAVNLPQPADAASSTEQRPALAAAANGEPVAAADPIPETRVSVEPRPAADPVAEPTETKLETPPTMAAASETTGMPATPPLSLDSFIQFPAPPAARPSRTVRPAPSESGRAGAQSDPDFDEAPPVQSAGPSAGRPVQTAPRVGRGPLVAAALQTCQSDLRRFCSGVQPGGGRIAQCARKHFRELSPECSQAVLAVRAARREGGNQAGRY